MTEQKLKIKGMSCMHCVAKVEKALMELEGVEKAKVGLEEKEAKIEYDGTKTGIEEFKKAVEEAGYQAKG
jgi:copper chaperone